MKLGMLTACLPDRSLDDIAEWASDAGFQALEIAAWPAQTDRPFTAAHLDVVDFDAAAAQALRSMLAKRSLVASSLAYYDNPLHPDAGEREAIRAHLYRCVDAASVLGCPTVGTFVGRDPSRTVVENLREAEEFFPALVEHGKANGVDIVIENCVMEGWHPDGYPGNLAYSPELWEWMFGLGLKLNYDPSHLVWMGIDPVEAIRPYVAHVAHAQAKDIQVFPNQRTRYGWPGKVARDDPWDVGWWRYRVPGLGEVDWRRVVDVLYEGGFDGVLSVEHEDPVWGGTPELVEAGLLIAHRTLRPLLVPESHASDSSPSSI
jgi:sugar phosphate isomerase/epimerase